jgi:isopenicillin N synthase-like dioxygenase
VDSFCAHLREHGFARVRLDEEAASLVRSSFGAARRFFESGEERADRSDESSSSSSSSSSSAASESWNPSVAARSCPYKSEFEVSLLILSSWLRCDFFILLGRVYS